MRIDAFLNSVNLTKRRAIAQDMIAHNAIEVNDKAIKQSKEVKVGDVISMHYTKADGEKLTKKYQVLQIPTTKSIPKSSKDEYIKEIL